MALLTRKIIKQINRPLDLSFKIISKDTFKQKIYAIKLMGCLIYEQEDLFAFQDNTKLIVCSYEEIELGDENGDASSLFENTIFTSIDFHNTTTSNTKDMGYMFCECKAEQLDLSSFIIQNNVNMFAMFNLCNAYENNRIIMSNNLKQQIKTINVRYKVANYLGKYVDVEQDFWAACEEQIPEVIKSIIAELMTHAEYGEPEKLEDGTSDYLNSKHVLESMFLNGKCILEYKDLVEKYEIVHVVKQTIAKIKKNINKFD